MHKRQHANWLARRTFLVGSSAALAGLPELVRAQGSPIGESPKMDAPKLSAKIPAQQLREKFFDCAAHAKVERAAAEKFAAIFDRLGDQASLGELWPLLRRG